MDGYMILWAECLNENGNINKRGECNVCTYTNIIV